MNKRLGRFLISVPGALLAAFLYNQVNHTAYYKTIFSVQTADFNVLSNTLPTKLSQALQRKDLEEVQRTLNSNFGLFGIVVTDCKTENKECDQQKIVAVTQPKRSGWRDKVTLSTLSANPYDVLRDQLPITAEWGFKDARSTQIVPTGRVNQGKPIGRVYYIRRDPPDFIQDQINWVSTPVRSLQTLVKLDVEQAGKELYQFVDSGANKYYFLTNLLGLVVGIGGWRTWEQIVREKRLQQAANDRKEYEYQEIIERMKGEIADQEINRITNEQLDDLFRSVDREIHQLKADKSELQENYQLLENEHLNLKSEISKQRQLDVSDENIRLKNENQTLQKRIVELEARQIEPKQCEEDLDEATISVSTAVEALQAATNHFPILEIWKTAFDSAKDMNMDDYEPGKVYSSLAVLAEVGEAHFNGSVSNDLQAVFKGKGVACISRESKKTIAQYGDERTFSHEGRRILMVRHIKIGRNYRIHFEFDKSERRIVVGYCGKHLRTSTGA